MGTPTTDLGTARRKEPVSTIMEAQARKKRPIRGAAVASVVVVAVAAVASSYLWWNTNLLGADSFCGGRMESGEVEAVLGSTGRVSEVRADGDPRRPAFSCTVERTSRFVGGGDQRVTVRTHTEEGAFPFTTHVWKNPASRSYFTGGLTGAVSEDFGGYVVLPTSCRDKVHGPQDDGVLTVVEAEVERGTVDAAGLARLLTRSARQVAERAGCGSESLSADPALAAPSAPRATDVQNVCGVPGFVLPKEALVTSRAEPGQEQVNDASPGTWACDLHLGGSAKAVVSFSATSDRNLVEASTKAWGGSATLPDDKGRAGVDEAVLHCADGDVHFATKENIDYHGALRAGGIRGLASVEVTKATFQNFLDATAAAHSCPRVTIP
ncbi:hypothetical protein [Streptomyces halstedii]|uniref:hypothetical protein n=1 Tax=Streptomyces halstedii TaxID=1944 RepID=UPI0038041C5B